MDGGTEGGREGGPGGGGGTLTRGRRHGWKDRGRRGRKGGGQEN